MLLWVWGQPGLHTEYQTSLSCNAKENKSHEKNELRSCDFWEVTVKIQGTGAGEVGQWLEHLGSYSLEGKGFPSTCVAVLFSKMWTQGAGCKVYVNSARFFKVWINFFKCISVSVCLPELGSVTVSSVWDGWPHPGQHSFLSAGAEAGALIVPQFQIRLA